MRPIFIAIFILILSSCHEQKPFFAEYDIFYSGEEGYHTYRIPSVITTQKGTILAFCEGRSGRSDQSENDIVMKRSSDGGKSWSAVQIIAEAGRDCFNNPTAVTVKETGRILLMFQMYPAGTKEQSVVPGLEGDRICRSFIIFSDDDGLTWSEAEEITKMVKRPDYVTSIASGPGIGIQLRFGIHKGRILIPFNQGPWGDWRVYAVYSDDFGKTWQYGTIAPLGSKGMGNEVQMVELADGIILLNSRSAAGYKCRKIARSRDGGESWSPLVDEPQLREPQCAGSIIRMERANKSRESLLLYSGPADTLKLVDGTLFVSFDEGETWPLRRTIYEGPFAYSCLTVLNGKMAACLYEKDNYQKITLARFNLEWIGIRDP